MKTSGSRTRAALLLILVTLLSLSMVAGSCNGKEDMYVFDSPTITPRPSVPPPPPTELSPPAALTPQVVAAPSPKTPEEGTETPASTRMEPPSGERTTPKEANPTPTRTKLTPRTPATPTDAAEAIAIVSLAERARVPQRRTLNMAVSLQQPDGSLTEPTRDDQAALTWQSLDPEVATVDIAGNIRGVTPGTTTVKVSLHSLSATTEVTVTPAVRGDGQNDPKLVGLQLDRGHVIRLEAPGTGTTLPVLAVGSDGELTPLPEHEMGNLRMWSTKPNFVSVTHSGTVSTTAPGGAEIHASLEGTTTKGYETIVVLPEVGYWGFPKLSSHCSARSPQGETQWTNAQRVILYLDRYADRYSSDVVAPAARKAAETLGAKITFQINLFGIYIVQTPCPPGGEEERLAGLHRLLAGAHSIEDVIGVETIISHQHTGEGEPEPPIPPDSHWTKMEPPPGQPERVYIVPGDENEIDIFDDESQLLRVIAVEKDGTRTALSIWDPEVWLDFSFFDDSGLGRDAAPTASGTLPTDATTLKVSYRGRQVEEQIVIRARSGSMP